MTADSNNSPWSAFDSGDPGKLQKWKSIETIDALLGNITESVPARLTFPCWERLQDMRRELHGSWLGSEAIIDWLLATLIARENALLIGPPGGAKSEIVTRLYSLMGLSSPEADMELIRVPLTQHENLLNWWEDRARKERGKLKQFHYLLQRFVQPEELFGPIEIELLRRGIVVRVNFGMLTGPGVFAAFLDEIFTASPNLLNVLLTLLNERKYFNFGGMVPGDLLFLAAASNELPGGSEMKTEEFRAAYALLDRFAVRLRVDIPSASSGGLSGNMTSELTKATQRAVERESNRFTTGRPFSSPTKEMASLSDLLCLGRYLYQGFSLNSLDGFSGMDEFDRSFYSTAATLQRDATRLRDLHVSWTISPRKLKAIYKVALAKSLICQTNFQNNNNIISPGKEDLLAFTLIWDSSDQQESLSKSVRSQIGYKA